MKYKKKKFDDSDFNRVKLFLQNSFKNSPNQKNWLIDRWIFRRYFGQILQGTFNSWPDTVGLWEDNSGEIVAIVNSDGNIRGSHLGDAFIQLKNMEYSNDFLEELIEFAEIKLSVRQDSHEIIRMRVNSEFEPLKKILSNRNYIFTNSIDPIYSLEFSNYFKIELPPDYNILDSTRLSNREKGFAHGKAFGYYLGSQPDNNVAENAYRSLKSAPDYLENLDLCIVDKNNHIVAFATFWYDSINSIGIVEPLGTLPEYRKQGFGTVIIKEGINRLNDLNVRKLYVRSDQEFYKSLGFKLDFFNEIWEKRSIKSTITSFL